MSAVQFENMMLLVGEQLGVDVTSSDEIFNLFELASGGGGTATFEDCRRVLAAHAAQALLLIELHATEITQHFISVAWTWNGDPPLRKKKGRWEAAEGLLFYVEVARLNPAYGVSQWTLAVPPSKQLSARILIAPQLSWEEHIVNNTDDGSTLVVNCSGGAEDYALRVRAVNRGGTSPPSNVFIARPSRSRFPMTLDLPGPLPPAVREILDLEDQFKHGQKSFGVSAVEQFDELREALAFHLPELSQIFRLFALIRSSNSHESLYSLSHAQFRGVIIAAGLSPSPVAFSATDIIYTRVLRMLNVKVGSVEKAAAAERRVQVLQRAAEETGAAVMNDAVIGFTQFVAAMVRVSHALFRGHERGLAKQFERMMNEAILPLHARVTAPNRYDWFLRSRPGVCVFHEHQSALRAVFERFADLDASTKQAVIHSDTMNIHEWLALLEHGGFLDDTIVEAGPEQASTSLDFALPDMIRLTRPAATRIFVEVNLEDIQLDMVPVDMMHQFKTLSTEEKKDMFSEVVFDEFCLAVGSLMPFCRNLMDEAFEDPQCTAAELLDLFISEEFLPRFRNVKLHSPAPGSADGSMPKRGGTAVGEGGPQGGADESLVWEQDEWVEAACRGGGLRHLAEDIMDGRKYGLSLNKMSTAACKPDPEFQECPSSPPSIGGAGSTDRTWSKRRSWRYSTAAPLPESLSAGRSAPP
jgi:hypothetical protein